MTTVTFSPAIAIIAAEALRSAAWEIARKLAARDLMLATDDPFAAVMVISEGAAKAEVARIEELMACAATLSDLAPSTWAPYAPGMIGEIKADIEIAERRMAETSDAMEQARGTDRFDDARADHAAANQRVHQLTAV